MMLSLLNMTIKNCYNVRVLPMTDDNEIKYHKFLSLISNAIHRRLFCIDLMAITTLPVLFYEYILFCIIAAERHIDICGTGYENWITRANALRDVHIKLETQQKLSSAERMDLLTRIHDIVRPPISLGSFTYSTFSF